MAQESDGVYQFTNDLGALALRDPFPAGPVVVSDGTSLPPRWNIKRELDGILTIWTELKGRDQRLYMSYAGDPRVGTPLIHTSVPTRWKLLFGSDDFHMILAVPADLLAPGDKDGLAIDVGSSRSYPIATELKRLDVASDTQNWIMQSLTWGYK
ncbi:hypothetical protein ABH920_001947 [Catenulispora sp. EB89]|uniref:hypothetical protein n=1 Tax=Catenulispora sp. EB89 TaxID=3156257 RepID=UPI00351525B2